MPEKNIAENPGSEPKDGTGNRAADGIRQRIAGAVARVAGTAQVQEDVERLADAVNALCGILQTFVEVQANRDAKQDRRIEILTWVLTIFSGSSLTFAVLTHYGVL